MHVLFVLDTKGIYVIKSDHLKWPGTLLPRPEPIFSRSNSSSSSQPRIRTSPWIIVLVSANILKWCNNKIQWMETYLIMTRPYLNLQYYKMLPQLLIKINIPWPVYIWFIPVRMEWSKWIICILANFLRSHKWDEWTHVGGIHKYVKKKN